MPAIFSEQQKGTIRLRMLEIGFQLIKKFGLKRMTIESVAKASGLAKGTFYTFFPSKEEFVFEIMQQKRTVVKQKLEERHQKHGPLDREQYRAYLQDVRDSDLGIYSYLTEEDVAWLHARWPEEYRLDPNVDERTTKWMLGHLGGLRPDCDWRILANCWKAMAILDINRELLYPEVYEQTLGLYREALLNYLYGEEERLQSK